VKLGRCAAVAGDRAAAGCRGGAAGESAAAVGEGAAASGEVVAAGCRGLGAAEFSAAAGGGVGGGGADVGMVGGIGRKWGSMGSRVVGGVDGCVVDA
jgi:hypothetical protein